MKGRKMNRLADRAWGGEGCTSAVASQPTTPLTLLLDAREAAQALRMGARTLARLTAAGSLPCVRIGRRVLYDPCDLTAWIDRQKKNPKIAADSI
ncbi:MAG: helix-turn-helix domain-containing protein [Planctomycetes bacterium]|nr:helix-turn-helix domain-containing protein [Planctomycetota bacterium]